MTLMVILAWLGCLFAYLASPKQRLLAHNLPRLLAWAFFVLLQGVAIYLLGASFHPITAFLIWLALIMAMWLSLTLLAAHWAGRLWRVNLMAVALFSAVMLIGA